MERFSKVFNKTKCNIIGMVHVDALPGTPLYKGNWPEIVEKAKYEINVYLKHKLDSILLENMHDTPYVQHQNLGPETVACMTRIAVEAKACIPFREKVPLGIQILACGNKQALSIAKACQLDYIRAEGFVFGHVADEGYTDAQAGELLRYRKQIDASNVLVFTDLKKKHSSHAITKDVSLLETAKAAEFFLTDGIIITGNSTGDAAKPQDFQDLVSKVNVPLLVGSGVTKSNIDNYYKYIDAAIIGSHFKKQGLWSNDLCEEAIAEFMLKVQSLRM
ncbi:uncharacterized protein F13E9.13, mitochondrial [Haematobia irritans]|uniref:uncharacterized protein F13E9.13, mitochondrial n=1 Tax=Haematobia irritans TaxID=7368 RepID=UPI003F509DAC